MMGRGGLKNAPLLLLPLFASGSGAWAVSLELVQAAEGNWQLAPG